MSWSNWLKIKQIRKIIKGHIISNKPIRKYCVHWYQIVNLGKIFYSENLFHSTNCIYNWAGCEIAKGNSLMNPDSSGLQNCKFSGQKMVFAKLLQISVQYVLVANTGTSLLNRDLNYINLTLKTKFLLYRCKFNVLCKIIFSIHIRFIIYNPVCP